jgi:hypothetical protein
LYKRVEIIENHPFWIHLRFYVNKYSNYTYISIYLYIYNIHESQTKARPYRDNTTPRPDRNDRNTRQHNATQHKTRQNKTRKDNATQYKNIYHRQA